MKIADYFDYREYLRAYVKSLPKRGAGELSKIANSLDIQTSVLSQILNGRRELTMEQASLLTDYLNLNAEETNYLFELVQYERAKTAELKKKLKKRILKSREMLLSQGSQAPEVFALSKNEREHFYSNWYYVAIWLLSSLDVPHTISSISKRFSLPPDMVEEAVEFLVKAKLCTLSNGHVKIGPQRTHLEGSDGVRRRHHLNWRIKAMDHILLPYLPSNFHFSFPVSLSKEDSLLIKDMLREFINRIELIVKPSKAEKIFCFNMDWFEL